MTKKKREQAKPCKECGGLGVTFPRFRGSEHPKPIEESLLRDGFWSAPEPDKLLATIERCDKCRKYPNDHAASAAIEGKARLYDEIMAVRETPAKKKKEDT
jgi:hypothetical protein